MAAQVISHYFFMVYAYNSPDSRLQSLRGDPKLLPITITTEVLNPGLLVW